MSYTTTDVLLNLWWVPILAAGIGYYAWFLHTSKPDPNPHSRSTFTQDPPSATVDVVWQCSAINANGFYDWELTVPNSLVVKLDPLYVRELPRKAPSIGSGERVWNPSKLSKGTMTVCGTTRLETRDYYRLVGQQIRVRAM